MQLESLFFSISSSVAFLGWVILIFFPRSKPTQILIHQKALALFLGLIYVIALAVGLPKAPQGAGFGSLDAVSLLFSERWALLAGWIHYLAFDLFVGGWISQDFQEAEQSGVRSWLRPVYLLLTFCFGPLGLLAYAVHKYLFAKPNKKKKRTK